MTWLHCHRAVWEKLEFMNGYSNRVCIMQLSLLFTDTWEQQMMTLIFEVFVLGAW